MKLKLQLHSSPLGPIRAAFLRGKAPQHWLGTLQSWGIPLSDLEVYAVPQSKSDLQVAGLLLIHRNGHFPTHLDLQEPYRCIGHALLIPQYASIQPQAADEEWKNLLIYDWHFFHPGIGMVGFNHSDRVNLADLLTYPAPLEQDWTLAKAGTPSAPVLRQISVVQPKVEDIFAQVQGVGDKDLKELGKNKPSAEDAKDLRSTLLNSLEKLLSQRPNLREGQTQGWLGKMLDRLELSISKMLADLQKQRESEIDRLIRLYQDDPEEALRYSIPLDSPYEGRGIAPPSGLLGRNNAPDFNLGGLNTGGPRDNWNLDAQRQIALRQHYLRLANQKIAEGDYRKAAYIHAHLLGDFYTAANVLEQGKHFYEAAILYRDHLKDKQQAARCFEKGGLYVEAIDLYLELGQKEKAGDLYVHIDQWIEAEKLYQNCAAEALNTSNYLEAARIYDHKLKDQNQAKGSLLKGWHDKLNPIACLNRYFVFFQQASNADFDAEVLRIYQAECKPAQRNAFMEVLKEMGKNKQRRAELPYTREIVYQIVSDELKNDNLGHIGMLEIFVPRDRLLGGDVSRYSVEVKQRIVLSKKHEQYSDKQCAILVKTIDLDPGINWVEACMLNHKLLALGKKGNMIFLFNSDLDTLSENYHTGFSSSSLYNQLFSFPNYSTYLGVTESRWKSGHFESVENLTGQRLEKLDLILPKSTLAIAAFSQEKFAKLVLNGDQSITLHICNANGEIFKSLLCRLKTGEAFRAEGTIHWGDYKTIPFRFGYFYFHFQVLSEFYCIDQHGLVERIQAEGSIAKIALADENTAKRLVIKTASHDNFSVFGCQYFRLTSEGILPCGEQFEKNVDVDHLLFTAKGLIVTEKNQVRTYDTHGLITPRKMASFELNEDIVSLFKGPIFDQVGFLTKSGKVLFYEISDLDT
jgi:MoxR-vWA-beta-propeller ternary system domain bpX3